MNKAKIKAEHIDPALEATCYTPDDTSSRANEPGQIIWNPIGHDWRSTSLCP